MNEPIEVSSEPIVAALRKELAQVTQDRELLRKEAMDALSAKAALAFQLAQAQQERDTAKAQYEYLVDCRNEPLSKMDVLRQERDSMAAALDKAKRLARITSVMFRNLSPSANITVKESDWLDTAREKLTAIVEIDPSTILLARDERMRREVLDALEHKFTFDRTYYGSDIRQVCDELREDK
jgi:septal ring factor EnvC (AmiA/AmiB activator)